jgi:hypothetical protein
MNIRMLAAAPPIVVPTVSTVARAESLAPDHGDRIVHVRGFGHAAVTTSAGGVHA